ncbi:MAG: hypothetical protein GX946_11460 [Oligosphaeraceae bacterium]|nr:hypothetical protein [Oligosphaeraceae bacterium]
MLTRILSLLAVCFTLSGATAQIATEQVAGTNTTDADAMKTKANYTVFIPDPGELPTSQAQEIFPDPLDIRIDIDFEKTMPALRALHGVTNYTPLHGPSCSYPYDLKTMIRDLHIPCSYFHDDPYVNPGRNLIDVSRIFPLFHADENDPANYIFNETDDYLRTVVEDGVRIIYRLGETIEVGTHYRTRPPKDYAKWTRICLNIVRHYTQGWGNGFHWPMKDWAVWEEPNNPNLWHGDFEEYLQLYKVFAPEFKKHFPDLNVGGPQTTTIGYRFLEQFLKFVRDEKLPLDFVNYTAYYLTPAELLSESVKRREMLDQYGFHSVPLGTNEWHCSPRWYAFSDPVGYGKERRRFGGVEGAVFAAAVLCGMQDTPLQHACFYSIRIPGGYGIFDGDDRPTATYYVFHRFARIFTNSTRRLATSIANASANTQSIASVDKQGNIEVLCGCYSLVRGQLSFGIPEGYTPERVEQINDDCHPRFAEMDGAMVGVQDGRVTLSKHECATAYYLKFVRK